MDVSTLIGRSWQELSPAEQSALAELFGTAPGVAVVRSFTEEERELLSSLYLDCTGRDAEIEAVESVGVKLQPSPTVDGRNVVPAAVLTDPVSYAAYLEIVTTCPLVQLSQADFPVSNPP